MAVGGGENGGYATWAGRLEQAGVALRSEARWLTAEVGGPFEMVGRMVASDVWGGPYADQLRGAVRFLDGQVYAWGEHLGRLCGALEVAAAEAAQAARLESAGIVPDFDLPEALAPWRRWPAPSPMLPSDWSWCGSRSANFVWVDPDRSRVLTEGMRTTAAQLRAACNRTVTLLADIGLEAPLFLRLAADGLQEVADETDRRVALLEAVDRELAGRFRALAAELGYAARQRRRQRLIRPIRLGLR